MGRHARRNPGSGGRTSSPRVSIPKEIESCIRGRTVDLSTASKYHRRLFELARPRLQPLLIEKGENRFELKKDLWQFFLPCLEEVVRQHHSQGEMKKADFIAKALYRAGSLYKRHPASRAAESPKPLWPPDRPILEAWKRTDNSRFLLGGDFRLQVSGENSELEVRYRFSSDTTKLPKLEIEIEGEPVCALANSRFRPADPEIGRELRLKGKKVWDSLCKKLAISLGVLEPKAHRPLENLGKQAAYRHDHCGMSWNETARLICPQRHQHGHKCKENLRTQARQWYARERRFHQNLPALTG